GDRLHGPVREPKLTCIGAARASAREPPRRVLRALDGRDREGVLEEAEAHVRPEPATVSARAARIGRELAELHQPRVLRLPHLGGSDPRGRLDVVEPAALPVPVDRGSLPDRVRRPVPQNSPVSSRTPYQSAAQRSPPEQAQTASGIASATAFRTASVACIA